MTAAPCITGPNSTICAGSGICRVPRVAILKLLANRKALHPQPRSPSTAEVLVELLRRPVWFTRTRKIWRAPSLRLDLGVPDNLGPFVGFIADELAELDRRKNEGGAAQFGEPRF